MHQISIKEVTKFINIPEKDLRQIGSEKDKQSETEKAHTHKHTHTHTYTLTERERERGREKREGETDRQRQRQTEREFQATHSAGRRGEQQTMHVKQKIQAVVNPLSS